MMKDRELISLCLKFRNGVLGKKSSWGQCYVVAAPLQGYLNILLNKTYELQLGYVTIGCDITNHYWLELGDGRILDPTADQFNDVLGKTMPKIYIGERPDWYMVAPPKRTRKILK